MSDEIVLPDPPVAGGALRPDELEYMREVQDEHRPTVASLVRQTSVPDGMGGWTTTDQPARPVTVRVAQVEKVPAVLADRYGVGVLEVTMDLTTVRSGDRIVVTAGEGYEVVSDGAIGTWQTAQRVWAVRTVWPEGGA